MQNNATQAQADMHAMDKAAHHEAVMLLLHEKGVWTDALESELQVVKSRVIQGMLEKQQQELVQQGHLSVPEVFPDVPIDDA